MFKEIKHKIGSSCIKLETLKRKQVAIIKLKNWKIANIKLRTWWKFVSMLDTAKQRN